MKKVLLIVISIVVCACALQEQRELQLPQIAGIEGENFISTSAFKELELNMSRPAAGDFIANTLEKEAPLSPRYWCGLGISSDGLMVGQKILEEADLVLDFKGVKEVWIPIEGEPKKLYVFEVR